MRLTPEELDARLRNVESKLLSLYSQLNWTPATGLIAPPAATPPAGYVKKLYVGYSATYDGLLVEGLVKVDGNTTAIRGEDFDLILSLYLTNWSVTMGFKIEWQSDVLHRASDDAALSANTTAMLIDFTAVDWTAIDPSGGDPIGYNPFGDLAVVSDNFDEIIGNVVDYDATGGTDDRAVYAITGTTVGPSLWYSDLNYVEPDTGLQWQITPALWDGAWRHRDLLFHQKTWGSYTEIV